MKVGFRSYIFKMLVLVYILYWGWAGDWSLSFKMLPAALLGMFLGLSMAADNS